MGVQEWGVEEAIDTLLKAAKFDAQTPRKEMVPEIRFFSIPFSSSFVQSENYVCAVTALLCELLTPNSIFSTGHRTTNISPRAEPPRGEPDKKAKLRKLH